MHLKELCPTSPLWTPLSQTQTYYQVIVFTLSIKKTSRVVFVSILQFLLNLIESAFFILMSIKSDTLD